MDKFLRRRIEPEKEPSPEDRASLFQDALRKDLHHYFPEVKDGNTKGVMYGVETSSFNDKLAGELHVGVPGDWVVTLGFVLKPDYYEETTKHHTNEGVGWFRSVLYDINNHHFPEVGFKVPVPDARQLVYDHISSFDRQKHGYASYKEHYLFKKQVISL